MPREFKGLLKSPHKPSTDLRISIVLSDDEVEMFSEVGFVGRWPSSDMSVERSADNWFKLRLDENEWDFSPDDPTGFFLAAPLNAPGPKATRNPVENSARRTISTVAKLAMGAVLAMFLLSLGIVIGRYQLDGTQLGLANMLVLAAVLGAGWASIRTTGNNPSAQRETKASALKIDGPRAALRVSDVMREVERQTPTGAHPDLGQRNDQRSGSSESQEPISETSLPEDRDGPGSDQVDATVGEAGSISAVPDTPDTPDGRDGSGPPAPVPIESSEASLDEPSQAESPEDIEVVRSTSDARPTWIQVSYEEDPLASVLQDSETTTSGSDRSARSAEEADGSLLPTEAIKRYLASLARLEEDARRRNHNTGVPSKAASSEPDHAGGSTEHGIALTEIRGIGPALSKALGELGVSNVHDLAELDSNDLDYLQDQLGRFGPRIRSERWVEQARQMIGGA